MNKLGKAVGTMIIPTIIYACGSNSEKPKFGEDFLVNIDSLSKNKDISYVLSENIHRAENFNYRLVDVYKLFSLKRPLGGNTPIKNDSIFVESFDRIIQNPKNLSKGSYESIKLIKIEKSELGNKMTIDYDFGVRVRYEGKIEIYIPNDLQGKGLVLLRCNEYVDLKNFEAALSTVIGDLKRYIYDHELKNPQNEFAM